MNRTFVALRHFRWTLPQNELFRYDFQSFDSEQNKSISEKDSFWYHRWYLERIPLDWDLWLLVLKTRWNEHNEYGMWDTCFGACGTVFLSWVRCTFGTAADCHPWRTVFNFAAIANLTKNNEQSKFHARQLPHRQGPAQQNACTIRNALH